MIKVHTAALTVLNAGRSKRSRLRILAGFRAVHVVHENKRVYVTVEVFSFDLVRLVPFSLNFSTIYAYYGILRGVFRLECLNLRQ